MFEIELKFQVPAAHQAAVLKAACTASAATSRLQARYFDTPDRRLAAAHVALRLRQENDTWVQTVKGQGDNGIRRLEHEVRLPGEPIAQLDIRRHAGTEAGRLLGAALGDSTGSLQEIFATDVTRTHRLIHSDDAVIELAFDVGTLRAGEATAPLCELEFELKSGPLASLFAVAERWALRHGLWLDVRSKSERGELLARGASAKAPTRAVAPALTREMSKDAALRCLVGTCLDQVLPNLSALAAGVGTADHLHQARVGLRRLHTALKLWGKPEPRRDTALAVLFASLGGPRDLDALQASVLPALVAAGAPIATLAAPPSAANIADSVRGTRHLAVLLQLLAFALGASAEDDDGEKSMVQKADAALMAERRKLLKAARRFAQMDDTERHRLRKRLKRLRYGIELSSALFNPKKIARELKRLRPAQDALGRYNDLCVAEALFRTQTAVDPRAWFAVGWLTAARQAEAELAGQALKRLRKSALSHR